MSNPTASLTNLPDELTLRILHFAGWRSAIKLGETCRKFRDVCEEPTFWHEAVMKTFHMRLDNFSQDGNWRQAFKTLTTGRFYGWGKNLNSMFLGDLGRPGFNRRSGNSLYPKLLEDKQYQGVVDVQSGGWSISLLMVSGLVIIGGSLDGATSLVTTAPRTLRFPDPQTRICQISCGRSHLLALSDGGKVWSVRGSGATAKPALIRFVSSDGVLEDSTCKKVVAGWSASGALVEGRGIYLWFDDARPYGDESPLMPHSDPQYVRKVDIKDIPYFSPYAWSSLHPQGNLYKEDPVVDFTIGENYVIIVTSSGKVFAVSLSDLLDDQMAVAPMQLLKFSAPQGQPRIDRVEGQFRRFAVFNKNGLVHIMEAENLDSAKELTLAEVGGRASDLDAMKTDHVSPRVVEGLDEYNIVDVAFGDWHCLALTDTGKVLSWGTESQGCGSLGLGPLDEARKKGVQWRPNRDGILNIPQIVAFDHPYSEASANYEGTTAYAYKISAAGWHSCALVAVAEENSTLTAGGISQTGDGASDSKGKSVSSPPAGSSDQAEPELPPSIEKGHSGGIVGTQSDARGIQGGLAKGTIAHGGQSHLGISSPSSKALPLKTERGHRGGIVGVQSEARGGRGGLAEGTIARGGSSFFGMTGGPLQLGEDDSLNESREKRKKAEVESGE